MGRPLKEDGIFNNPGVFIFRIILRYADHFEPMALPVQSSDYYVILKAPGQHKVINIGEGWLVSNEKIAFISSADYQELIRIIDSRLGIKNYVGTKDEKTYIQGATPENFIAYQLRLSKPREIQSEESAIKDSRVMMAKMEKRQLESKLEYAKDPAAFSDQVAALDRVIQPGLSGQSNAEGKGDEGSSDGESVEQPKTGRVNDKDALKTVLSSSAQKYVPTKFTSEPSLSETDLEQVSKPASSNSQSGGSREQRAHVGVYPWVVGAGLLLVALCVAVVYCRSQRR